MRTYLGIKRVALSLLITQGPHFDADATMAVPEFHLKQLLHPTACLRCRRLIENSFLAVSAFI